MFTESSFGQNYWLICWPTLGWYVSQVFALFWPSVDRYMADILAKSWLSWASVEYLLTYGLIWGSVEQRLACRLIPNQNLTDIWLILDWFPATDTWLTVTRYISCVSDECSQILGLCINRMSVKISVQSVDRHFQQSTWSNYATYLLVCLTRKAEQSTHKDQCTRKWMCNDKKLPGDVLVWHDLKRLLLEFWTKRSSVSIWIIISVYLGKNKLPFNQSIAINIFNIGAICTKVLIRKHIIVSSIRIYLKTGALPFDIFTGAGFGCFIIEKRKKERKFNF